MSDHSQAIVDLDASPEEAPVLARRVIEDLISRDIIIADQSDCVLGAELGHRPGVKVFAACVADKPSDHFLTLWTNGVYADTERRLFDTGQNGLSIECSACRAVTKAGFAIDDGIKVWIDAVDAWSQGEGDDTYACPKCGHAAPARDWKGESVDAVGNLGFVFYNWPDLKPDFVAGIAALLGHEVRVVRCHT